MGRAILKVLVLVLLLVSLLQVVYSDAVPYNGSYIIVDPAPGDTFTLEFAGETHKEFYLSIPNSTDKLVDFHVFPSERSGSYPQGLDFLIGDASYFLSTCHGDSDLVYDFEFNLSDFENNFEEFCGAELDQEGKNSLFSYFDYQDYLEYVCTEFPCIVPVTVLTATDGFIQFSNFNFSTLSPPTSVWFAEGENVYWYEGDSESHCSGFNETDYYEYSFLNTSEFFFDCSDSTLMGESLAAYQSDCSAFDFEVAFDSVYEHLDNYTVEIFLDGINRSDAFNCYTDDNSFCLLNETIPIAEGAMDMNISFTDLGGNEYSKLVVWNLTNRTSLLENFGDSEIIVNPPDFDDFASVLDLAGYTYEVVANFAFADYLLNKSPNSAFLNCDQFSYNFPESKHDLFRNFVSGGGVLYQSDYQIDLFDLLFPDVLNQGHLHGDPQIVNASIVDSDLQEYLGKETIQIEYDLGGWIPIEEINNSDNVTVLLTNNVTLENESYANYTNDGVCFYNASTNYTQELPMALRYDYGDGSVFLTSFHLHGTQGSDPDSLNLMKYFLLQSVGKSLFENTTDSLPVNFTTVFETVGFGEENNSYSNYTLPPGQRARFLVNSNNPINFTVKNSSDAILESVVVSNLTEVNVSRPSDGVMNISVNSTYDGTHYITLLDLESVSGCDESWVAYNTSCNASDNKTMYYLDENTCGTYFTLPGDNGTIFGCDYCTPNMTVTAWGAWSNLSCLGDNMNQTRNATNYDQEECGEIENSTIYDYQLVGPNYVNGTFSDWVNYSMCYENNTLDQTRNMFSNDSYGCAQQIIYSEYNATECDFCTPVLANSSWGDWITLSCDGDTSNQTRTKDYYDTENCGEVDNVTYTENRTSEPIYLNTSVSAWYNISLCYENNTILQQSNYTTYDNNSCAANVTYFENRTYTCDFCTPEMINSTASDWSNQNCVGDVRNQSRFITNYDNKTCGEEDNTTYYEYRMIGPVHVNGSFTDWYNASICYENNTIEQQRNLTAPDTYACAADIVYYEDRVSGCDYCTPDMLNTSWSVWANESCLENGRMNQSRYLVEYDNNTCGEVDNTTYYEYTQDNTCGSEALLVIDSPINTTYTNSTVEIDMTSNGDIVFYNGTGNETYSTALLRDYGDGQHTLTAWANLSESEVEVSVVFTIDTQGPGQLIGLSSSNITSYSFDLNWTNPVSTYENKIYFDGSYEATTSEESYSFGSLSASTSYNITIESYDAFGNYDVSNITVVTTAATCGDGICHSSENPGSCAQDCSGELVFNLTTILGNSDLGSNDLELSIGGSNRTYDYYTGDLEVIFESNDSVLIEFSHNFSEQELNLSNVSIVQNNVSNDSYLIIKNLNLTSTKAVYLDKTNPQSNAVCVYDAAVENVSQLIASCSQLSCPGTAGGVSCSVVTGGYKIQGLTHSGVIEDYVAPPPPSGGSGGSSGGSSGGGVSAPKTDYQVFSTFKTLYPYLDVEYELNLTTIGTHTFEINEIYSNYFIVDIGGEDYIVRHGESVKVDFNGDEVYDLEMRNDLNINSERVEISVRRSYETYEMLVEPQAVISDTTPVVEDNVETIDAEDEIAISEKEFDWTLPIVLVVVGLFVAGVFLVLSIGGVKNINTAFKKHKLHIVLSEQTRAFIGLKLRGGFSSEDVIASLVEYGFSEGQAGATMRLYTLEQEIYAKLKKGIKMDALQAFYKDDPYFDLIFNNT